MGNICSSSKAAPVASAPVTPYGAPPPYGTTTYGSVVSPIPGMQASPMMMAPQTVQLQQPMGMVQPNGQTIMMGGTMPQMAAYPMQMANPYGNPMMATMAAGTAGVLPVNAAPTMSLPSNVTPIASNPNYPIGSPPMAQSLSPGVPFASPLQGVGMVDPFAAPSVPATAPAAAPPAEDKDKKKKKEEVNDAESIYADFWLSIRTKQQNKVIQSVTQKGVDLRAVHPKLQMNALQIAMGENELFREFDFPMFSLLMGLDPTLALTPCGYQLQSKSILHLLIPNDDSYNKINYDNIVTVLNFFFSNPNPQLHQIFYQLCELRDMGGHNFFLGLAKSKYIDAKQLQTFLQMIDSLLKSANIQIALLINKTNEKGETCLNLCNGVIEKIKVFVVFGAMIDVKTLTLLAETPLSEEKGDVSGFLLATLKLINQPSMDWCYDFRYKTDLLLALVGTPSLLSWVAQIIFIALKDRSIQSWDASVEINQPIVDELSTLCAAVQWVPYRLFSALHQRAWDLTMISMLAPFSFSLNIQSLSTTSMKDVFQVVQLRKLLLWLIEADMKNNGECKDPSFQLLPYRKEYDGVTLFGHLCSMKPLESALSEFASKQLKVSSIQLADSINMGEANFELLFKAFIRTKKALLMSLAYRNIHLIEVAKAVLSNASLSSNSAASKESQMMNDFFGGGGTVAANDNNYCKVVIDESKCSHYWCVQGTAKGSPIRATINSSDIDLYLFLIQLYRLQMNPNFLLTWMSQTIEGEFQSPQQPSIFPFLHCLFFALHRNSELFRDSSLLLPLAQLTCGTLSDMVLNLFTKVRMGGLQNNVEGGGKSSPPAPPSAQPENTSQGNEHNEGEKESDQWDHYKNDSEKLWAPKKVRCQHSSVNTLVTTVLEILMERVVKHRNQHEISKIETFIIFIIHTYHPPLTTFNMTTFEKQFAFPSTPVYRTEEKIVLNALHNDLPESFCEALFNYEKFHDIWFNKNARKGKCPTKEDADRLESFLFTLMRTSVTKKYFTLADHILHNALHCRIALNYNFILYLLTSKKLTNQILRIQKEMDAQWKQKSLKMNDETKEGARKASLSDGDPSEDFLVNVNPMAVLQFGGSSMTSKENEVYPRSAFYGAFEMGDAELVDLYVKWMKKLEKRAKAEERLETDGTAPSREEDEDGESDIDDDDTDESETSVAASLSIDWSKCLLACFNHLPNQFNAELIERCILNGAVWEEVRKYKESIYKVLKTAIQQSNTEIIELLFHFGVDYSDTSTITPEGEYDPPLLIALKGSQWEPVKTLVECGAQFSNNLSPSVQFDLLRSACSSRNRQWLELLVMKLKVNINVKNEPDETVLVSFIRDMNAHVVKDLLYFGADPFEKIGYPIDPTKYAWGDVHTPAQFAGAISERFKNDATYAGTARMIHEMLMDYEYRKPKSKLKLEEKEQMDVIAFLMTTEFGRKWQKKKKREMEEKKDKREAKPEKPVEVIVEQEKTKATPSSPSSSSLLLISNEKMSATGSQEAFKDTVSHFAFRIAKFSLKKASESNKEDKPRTLIKREELLRAIENALMTPLHIVLQYIIADPDDLSAVSVEVDRQEDFVKFVVDELQIVLDESEDDIRREVIMIAKKFIRKLENNVRMKQKAVMSPSNADTADGQPLEGQTRIATKSIEAVQSRPAAVSPASPLVSSTPSSPEPQASLPGTVPPSSAYPTASASDVLHLMQMNQMMAMNQMMMQQSQITTGKGKDDKAAEVEDESPNSPKKEKKGAKGKKSKEKKSNESDSEESEGDASSADEDEREERHKAKEREKEKAKEIERMRLREIEAERERQRRMEEERLRIERERLEMERKAAEEEKARREAEEERRRKEEEERKRKEAAEAEQKRKEEEKKKSSASSNALSAAKFVGNHAGDIFSAINTIRKFV